MHKKIIISFSPQIGKEQREQISEKINTVLEPVSKEVNAWNGFVDYVEAEPGYFVFIAKCDNDEIREVMQLLIDGSQKEEQAPPVIKHNHSAGSQMGNLLN